MKNTSHKFLCRRQADQSWSKTSTRKWSEKTSENGVMVWLWRRILFNGFSERGRIWNSLKVDWTHPDFSIHTYLTKVIFTWRLVDMVLLTIWLLLTLILIAQSNVLSNKCERRITKNDFVLLTILAKDIRSWALKKKYKEKEQPSYNETLTRPLREVGNSDRYGLGGVIYTFQWREHGSRIWLVVVTSFGDLYWSKSNFDTTQIPGTLWPLCHKQICHK